MRPPGWRHGRRACHGHLSPSTSGVGARSGSTGGTNPARSSTENSNPGIWDGPAGGLSSLVSQDYLLSDLRRTAGSCLCSMHVREGWM